jgi:uncharacterized protein YukE
MRRNRQKEKTPDASGHMAAAPGVCCYLFVLVCEIEFLAVIVRIRHTFQLGKGLLGQRPHIPVHTRHGCGDLAYRPASVCVVVHTDQIFFFHGKVHHSSYLQFIFLGSGRRLFRAGGLFAVGKLLADRWPGLANTHITALIFVNHGIKADNAARQEWNRTVDVALVEGVPEEDILKIKQEKITDETLQSIRTYGWLPEMFRQIIRGAKNFLQEVIFKFKLQPKPVPKIDLQEWKDMQKVMYDLQGQSREIKRTQQDISSLKKQLSELRGFFKGKERKSLEGKIEMLEDLEKRLHKSMEQIVKREGYPNVQAFQKVYNKAEALIMEYNEELRAWKNQTEQKKENPLEQPKKASVLEKLHRYQQEGRQQPKRSVKKKSMDRER